MADQPNPVYQSSNSNPTVQYRTPDGQITESPLNEAPPQVQLLYQQLPQAQAQTSTAVSGAKVAGVQAQQAPAQINLGADLANKMTLDDALKKYTPLGKTPDEIFNQYLASSPYGLPKESPQDLMNKGISADALGKIGTPSFMDRFNTKNAIVGLRDLQDKWHKTNAGSQLASLVGLSPDIGAYNNAKTILGSHLSSLIPGASGAQATGQSLTDTLPSPVDPREYMSGNAEKQFSSVEDQLLKTKGYSYKDLGVDMPTTSNKPSSGGELLNTILGNAGKEISNTINPYESLKLKASDSDQQKQDKFKQLTNMLVDQSQSSTPVGIIKNTLAQYLGIAQDPKKAFTEKPISTTLAVLGPLLGLKGGGSEGAVGETSAAETATLPKVGGNPLMDFLKPGGQISRGGNFRDAVITTADKAGAVIKGDDIASNLRTWADKAKLSNLPDAQAIEDTVNAAEKTYAGKTFKPSEVQSIYDGIEKGYTKGGEPRSATSSYIDRGVKQVLADQLDEITGNQWSKGTSEMAQGYSTQKSPIRKYAKVGAGLGIGSALGGNAVSKALQELLHIL